MGRKVGGKKRVGGRKSAQRPLKKGRVRVKYQNKTTGEIIETTVRQKKQTARGKKQDLHRTSQRIRLTDLPGIQHARDSRQEIQMAQAFKKLPKTRQQEGFLETKFVSPGKPGKVKAQVKTVKLSVEEKAVRHKKEEQKEQRKEKQERVDLIFLRAGITEKQINASQMDRAQIKRLLKRATDNGAEAGDVTDLIDFESPFEDNVRANPLFVKNLEEKSAQKQGLSDGDRQWAENHFIQKANDSNQPEKYQLDAQTETEPVRDQITTAWVKNPTSKKGGDVDGVDDGNRKLNLKKFTEAFNREDKDILQVFKETNREESFQQTQQRVHSDIANIPYPQERKQKAQEFDRFLKQLDKKDPGKAQRQQDEERAIQRVKDVTRRQAERKRKREQRKRLKNKKT